MNSIGKSEEIKAGLQGGFQHGSFKMAHRRCYGYDIVADGKLVIILIPN